MTSLSTLDFRNVRNKKALIRLYHSQFSVKYILKSINKILNLERTEIPLGKRQFSKNISSREVLHFIYRNGVPDGYQLSDEMKMKLREFQKETALKRVGDKTENDEK